MSYFDIFLSAVYKGAGTIIGLIIGFFIFSILFGFFDGIHKSISGKKNVSEIETLKQGEKKDDNIDG